MKKTTISFLFLMLFLLLTTSSSLAANYSTVYELSHRDHFGPLYSADANEVKVLRSRGWMAYETWRAPKSGTPVYRLNHPASSRHLFTTDRNEVEVLCASQGWVKDNNGQPVFYSGGSVPIYRSFNVYNGMHTLGSLSRILIECQGDPIPEARNEGIKLYGVWAKTFK